MSDSRRSGSVRLRQHKLPPARPPRRARSAKPGYSEQVRKKCGPPKCGHRTPHPKKDTRPGKKDTQGDSDGLCDVLVNGESDDKAVSLAEEDVIDGFLILSFVTYQDLEMEIKSSEDKAAAGEGVVATLQSEGEPESLEVLEKPLTNGNHIFDGYGASEKSEATRDNNNEVAMPNQNFVVTPSKIELLRQTNERHNVTVNTVTVPEKSPEVRVTVTATVNTENVTPSSNCDTAEEDKKVPPDPEPQKSESPEHEVAQTPSKRSSPFPVKPPHFLPVQNGPLQQPEPSAAVAAVTVTVPTSSPRQPVTSSAGPLPSSTSPAGGVPFPSSLLRHEEFPVSPATTTTVANTPKSVAKNVAYEQGKPRSDVVHSLPYPIPASYSDYAVNYQYSGNRAQPLDGYYHHHHGQQPDKYAKESDGYKRDVYPEGRYDPKTAKNNGDLSARYGSQAYSSSSSSDKACDLQPIYRKSNTTSISNFQSNELLTQNTNGNIGVKDSEEKPAAKLTSEAYPNASKTKVLNRTTYYQTIVNKTHSRHKSSRRVLPSSAYDTSKQLVSSGYANSKPEAAGVKPASQYLSHHYTADAKKNLNLPLASTASTTAAYNTVSYNKSDAHHHHNNNSLNPSNCWTDTRYASSKQYKTNPEQPVSNHSYRDKQLVSSTLNNNSSNKQYNNYPQNNRVYPEAHRKVNDSASAYNHGDYYHKSNVVHSRAETNQGAIGDTYKSSNHNPEYAGYVSKSSSSSYHISKNPEKSRSYYQVPANSAKSYQNDVVPKPEESHGYHQQQSNGKPYHHHHYYGNPGVPLKTKESVQHCSDPPKVASREYASSALTESQPSTSEGSSCYPSGDKPSFYPYADSTHYHHRRTPPVPTTKAEPSIPKDTECPKVSTSSVISPYLPRPAPASSPPPSTDDGSRRVAKTLWSPTVTTASNGYATRPEVVATSSRDSHSSHSNSSISSLSQLSQPFASVTQGASTQSSSSKDLFRDGRSNSSSNNGHSRSSSRNETPVCIPVTPTTTSSNSNSTNTSTTTVSTSASYGISGSLTSLIFSKPSWTSPSVTTVLTNPGSTHPHLTPPGGSGRLGSPVPSVLPLAPSLPSGHHSSPFGPTAALHSAGHHVMFAPPLPPAGSLSSPSLPPPPIAGPTGPAAYASESLFPPSNQDLLRRELDTRFLASQDRSINVPPPPYLRAEMHQHQHQHTHMHQHSPFLPPPIGGSLLPPAAAHLYDKFHKVDSSFYGRNALGLPTYPSLSPLLAPGAATATPTPFAPPGHLAAFQPKMNSLVKTKSVKSGRWCAMHVRISWEIYHHQQKQQQAEAQKSGAKTVPELLRPPNHLFGSLPRPHDLGFSSPLLTAAAVHGRSPYDVAPQHPGFLGPTPAHLGMTPFARPTYPGFGTPGAGFGGLGSLAGLTGATMLGRDLSSSYFGAAQDPWSRLHRTPPNFPSPSAITPSSWGGLKAEADRDRLQRREDQEREREKEKEKLKKAELEKREKENEKAKEVLRDSKREHEKQKERDRENRVSHVPPNPESVRNGDMPERGRDREREWDRPRRDSSRSPIRTTHKLEQQHQQSPYDAGAKPDVKVKEEKHDDDRKGPSPPKPTELPPASEYARVAPTMGPPPHFWNPLPPEQLMQKYATLDRYRDAEGVSREERAAYEHAKLPPPPLRPNDPPYVPPPGLFPSLANPFLYPPRTKPSSPVALGNGVPPPLIPCVGGQQGGSPGATPSPMHLKELYPVKERREQHPTEVESQSR